MNYALSLRRTVRNENDVSHSRGLPSTSVSIPRSRIRFESVFLRRFWLARRVVFERPPNQRGMLERLTMRLDRAARTPLPQRLGIPPERYPRRLGWVARNWPLPGVPPTGFQTAKANRKHRNRQVPQLSSQQQSCRASRP